LLRLLVVRETDARHPISCDRPRRFAPLLCAERVAICRALVFISSSAPPDESRKSGAISESRAKYKQRFSSAMNFFGDWSVVVSGW
jgi:hypothetical protein